MCTGNMEYKIRVYSMAWSKIPMSTFVNFAVQQKEIIVTN